MVIIGDNHYYITHCWYNDIDENGEYRNRDIDPDETDFIPMMDFFWF